MDAKLTVRSVSSSARGADLLEQCRGSKPQRELVLFQMLLAEPGATAGASSGIPGIMGWTLSGHCCQMPAFFFFKYNFFNQGRKSVSSVFSILPQLVGSFSFAP